MGPLFRVRQTRPPSPNHSCLDCFAPLVMTVCTVTMRRSFAEIQPSSFIKLRSIKHEGEADGDDRFF